MVNIVFVNFYTHKSERDYFHINWQASKLLESLGLGDRVVLIDLGPSLRSPANGVYLTEQSDRGNWRQVKSLIEHGTGKYRARWLQTLASGVRVVERVLRGRPVDLLIYSGHGGGIIVGSWGSATTPLMSIVDFAKRIAPLRPRIVAFDACYMGQVLPLYEVSQSVPSCKYIIASPSYSGTFNNVNISESDALGEFMTYKSQPLEWFKRLLRERRDRVKQRTYDCIVVYDTAPMRALARRIDQLAAAGKMYFTTDAIVYRNETNLLDLATVARQDPTLVKIMDRVVAPTAGLGVCPRTLGITIEHDSWFRYRNDYRRSKLWRAAPNLFNKPWLHEERAMYYTRISRAAKKAAPRAD